MHGSAPKTAQLPLRLEGVGLTLPSAAGPVEILRGVDMTVEPGERVGRRRAVGLGQVVADRGGGRVWSGRPPVWVKLFGEDLARLDEDGRARLRRGRVSLVFQAFHLLPNMTAEENVAAPLEIAGTPHAGRIAREWLERVGLGQARPPLSAPALGRRAAARGPGPAPWPRGPALLFADEPTGNLDGKTAEAVAGLMFDLVAEAGAALVLVTHDTALAARADRQVAHGGGAGFVIPLSLRFAAREMRAGVRGFRIFLACLALGVAAIAAASSTAEAFRRGLGPGGAHHPRRRHRDQRRPRFHPGRTRGFRTDWPHHLCRGVARHGPGPIGRPAAGRAAGGSMASIPWPGRWTCAMRPVGRRRSRRVFAGQGGLPGAAVEQALLDRLQLKLGQPFKAGNEELVAMAVLAGEPDRHDPRLRPRPAGADRLAGGAEGRLHPGQACSARRRGSPCPRARTSGCSSAPCAGCCRRPCALRDRYDATPGIRRLIDRLEYFLGFIGLASLVAGGLGVSQAVGAYLEGKKPSIAALKALGADGPLIRNLYLVQIAGLAALGIAIGLALGAACPFLLAWIAGNKLPVPALFAVYPGALLKAALFGALSAGAFCLLPLARARMTPPAALFRHDLSGRLGFGVELGRRDPVRRRTRRRGRGDRAVQAYGRDHDRRRGGRLRAAVGPRPGRRLARGARTGSGARGDAARPRQPVRPGARRRARPRPLSAWAWPCWRPSC